MEHFQDLKNNLKEIKKILKNVAECGTQIFDQSSNINLSNECLQKLTKSTLNLAYYKNHNKESICRELQGLQALNAELLESIDQKKSENQNTFVPAIFEALVTIFNHSDEEFRQHHYQGLVDFFYDMLCENTEKNVLNKVSYDQLIKRALPIVKMDLVSRWIQENLEYRYHRRIEALLLNLERFFKALRLNQEDIYEVIKNKVGSDDYTLISFELKPLDHSNGNLGEYFKLNIIVKLKEELQNYNFFVKFLSPKSKTLREMALSGISKKEEFFYMTYIPLLEKHGINYLQNCVPRCYFSRENDVIILDDLISLGFTALSPDSVIEYDALRKGVELLAKFHASSMILEEILSQKEGKKITLHDLFGQYFKEVFFVPEDSHFLNSCFQAGLASIHHLLKVFPELANRITDIENCVDKLWKLNYEKVKKSKEFKNTMCHGDMHVANTLFKFGKDKVCEDVYLIDFQTLRYCPPSHDLLFFIYENSTKEIRNKYLNILCEDYYMTISKHIKSFGLNVDMIYPRTDFEKSLKYMKSQSIAQALYYAPFIKLPARCKKRYFISEEKVNYYLYQCRWKLMDFGLEDEVFRDFVKGLIEELVEIFESGDNF